MSERLLNQLLRDGSAARPAIIQALQATLDRVPSTTLAILADEPGI
ncbi:MAG: hypothetical protein WD794_04070 [Mycobacteriales bacterium]